MTVLYRQCSFFSPASFWPKKTNSPVAQLLDWATSRYKLFLYWPMSKCASGKEGISPDLPLPLPACWAGVGEEGAKMARLSGSHRTKIKVTFSDMMFHFGTCAVPVPPSLCRSSVAPPSNTNWSLEWHDGLP